MATLEQESSHSRFSPPPPLELVLSRAEQLDPIQLAAVATDMMPVEPNPESDYTHVLIRDGEAIGAAIVYSRSVVTGLEKSVTAAEIEAFDTNPANNDSAYLAILNKVIENPAIDSIDGMPGLQMARVAAIIEGFLSPGWRCEYSIANGVEVTTFDPGGLPAQELPGVAISHTFKRTSRLRAL